MVVARRAWRSLGGWAPSRAGLASAGGRPSRWSAKGPVNPAKSSSRQGLGATSRPLTRAPGCLVRAQAGINLTDRHHPPVRQVDGDWTCAKPSIRDRLAGCGRSRVVAAAASTATAPQGDRAPPQPLLKAPAARLALGSRGTVPLMESEPRGTYGETHRAVRSADRPIGLFWADVVCAPPENASAATCAAGTVSAAGEVRARRRVPAAGNASAEAGEGQPRR